MSLHRGRFLQAAAVLPLAAGCWVSEEKTVMMPSIEVGSDLRIGRLPLLTKLRELESQIVERFPGRQQGLDVVGLNLRLHYPHGGYFNTPTNSRMFAETLGDGTHFSLLVEDVIDESLPVIMTMPAYGANVIVARNVSDFLRFGLIRGYFQMEQIGYNPKHALDAYNDANWHCPADRNPPLDFSIDARERAILDFIAEKLNLQPLVQSAEVMQQMQDGFLPRLQFKERHSSITVQFVGTEK